MFSDTYKFRYNRKGDEVKVSLAKYVYIVHTIVGKEELENLTI